MHMFFQLGGGWPFRPAPDDLLTACRVPVAIESETSVASSVMAEQRVAVVDRWQVEARTCLGHAAQTEWGRLFLRESPAFQDIYDRLAEEQIDDASRSRIIRSLEELYTFSPMINRTCRRDIGEFTTCRPETLTVEFTPDQRRLHDDLLDVVSRILARAHGEQNAKFMMTTIRRQAASCHRDPCRCRLPCRDPGRY